MNTADQVAGAAPARVHEAPVSAATAMAAARAWVVAVALAGLALGGAQASFIWHHFYSDAPLLFDSGWHANLLYHDGIVPVNPRIGHFYHYYYQGHLRPMLSVLSVLSYAVPVSRVAWYALIMGLSYALLVVAPGMVGYDRLARVRDRSALVAETMLGCLLVAATALSGPVLCCFGFPHFEIPLVASLNVAVYAWTTGRYRLALAACLMPAFIREDTGLIAAAFFAALGLWWWRNRRRWADAGDAAAAGRWCLGLGVFCLATSIVLFLVQKACFGSNSMLHEEYVGYGMSAHQLWVLAQRPLHFVTRSPQLSLPLALAMALAYRYRSLIPVTGWIGAGPYLLIHLFSSQLRRSLFNNYFPFPFVTALFIPLALEDMRQRRAGDPGESPGAGRLTLAAYAGCAVVSSVGYIAHVATHHQAPDPAAPALAVVATDAAGTDRAVAAFLDRFGAAGGHVPAYMVDEGMACHVLASEDPAPEEIIAAAYDVSATAAPVLFADRGRWSAEVIGELIAAGRQDVWRADRSIACAWLPPGAPALPAPWRRTDLVAEQLVADPAVVRDEDRFAIPAGFGAAPALWSRNLPLRAGTYALTWSVSGLTPPAGAGAAGWLEVASGDHVLAHAEVASPGDVVLTFTVAVPADDTTVNPTAPVRVRFLHQPGGAVTLGFAGLRCMHAGPTSLVRGSPRVEGLRLLVAAPPLVPGRSATMQVMLQRQASGIGAWDLQAEEPLALTWIGPGGQPCRSDTVAVGLSEQFRESTVCDCIIAVPVQVPHDAVGLRLALRSGQISVEVPRSAFSPDRSP